MTPHTLARIVASVALLIIPKGRRQWAQAMRAEFGCVEERDALAWSFGIAAAALQLRVFNASTAFAIAAISAVLVAIWVDWTATSDVPALLVVMLSSAAVAFVNPSRATLFSTLIGGCLLVVHGASNFSGLLWPSY